MSESGSSKMSLNQRIFNIHLNVIHGEEKGVLHPSVFPRLWSVGNYIDLCTEDAININSKTKGKLKTKMSGGFPRALATRHLKYVSAWMVFDFDFAWVVGEVKVAHVHVEVGPYQDWNAPVV